MSYELSFLAVSLFGPRLSRVGLRTCRYTPQEGSDQLDKEQHTSRGAEAPAVLATGELLTIGPDLHWPSFYLQRALVCDFLQGK